MKRDENQVGRAVIKLPWFLVNQILKSIEMAEDTLGQPPTMMQVFIWLQDNHYTVIKSSFEVAAMASSLFREDMIFCDKNFL